MDLKLLNAISESGLRIFTTAELIKLAQSIGIKESYLPKLTRKFVQEGLIRKLYRGTYALSNSLLSGAPLHKFEVIDYIERPSAICCWSALSFHGLSDQVVQNVYLMAPSGETSKNTSKTLYKIDHIDYIVIRVQPDYYFGVEKKFLNESVISITDVERTLLDGLIRPQYCGGFFEAIEAFRQAYNQDKITPQKIIGYAQKSGILVSKRLGWVFETLGIYPSETEYLMKIPCKGFYKLDVSKPNQGEWLRPWNLRRNI